MRNLGLKQGLGAFLQEKLSFWGFSAKIQGLAREKARVGRRVQKGKRAGV